MKRPSMDEWLKEAKTDQNAPRCGMYLFHNGTVRESTKAEVRLGAENAGTVTGMEFSCDRRKVSEAVEKAQRMPGIYYVRVWLNEGTLALGDDIMLVLIGGDIRPRVLDALEMLVGELKNTCVREREILGQDARRQGHILS